MQKKKFKWWKLFLILFLLPIIAVLCCPPHIEKSSGKLGEIQKCFSNQRRVFDAFERYNNDHNANMKNLDEELLIKEKYLNKYYKPSKCKYLIKGNFPNDYDIYCEFHGSINSTSKQYLEAKKDFENKQNLRAITYLTPIVIGVIIVVLLIIFL
jgi:hypothetical protein